MSKDGEGMKRLNSLDALADLHKAMGGEKAALPTESAPEMPAGPGQLYISRDKKARRGKEVTLIEGFDAQLHGDVAVDVARALKAHCGVGGGWKDGVILLQGDHRGRAADWLTASGYRVKHKGG
jgi:translation initiation factor 1